MDVYSCVFSCDRHVLANWRPDRGAWCQFSQSFAKDTAKRSTTNLERWSCAFHPRLYRQNDPVKPRLGCKRIFFVRGSCHRCHRQVWTVQLWVGPNMLPCHVDLAKKISCCLPSGHVAGLFFSRKLQKLCHVWNFWTVNGRKETKHLLVIFKPQCWACWSNKRPTDQ